MMALSEQEKSALKRFKDMLSDALRAEHPEINLFGSKARGDDQDSSDLDVLVKVSSNDWRICDQVYDIATLLLLETGICISAKIISRETFTQMRRAGSSFAGNVLRDAVPI